MIIIIKPTESCNAQCAYCSAHKTGANHAIMSIDVVRSAFESAAHWLRSNPSERVTWTWHGGEPLLAGKSFYRQVAGLQESVFDGLRSRVRNTFQSNLTLLDEGYLDLLSSFTTSNPFGTSFDICPTVRTLKGEQSYEEKWFKAVRLLESRGHSFGVGYVVHKEALGRAEELYFFFKHLCKQASTRFNPLYAVGRGALDSARPIHITPEEYGQFLVDLYGVWQSDDRSFSIQPITEWVGFLDGRSKGLCCDSSGRCHHTHLGLAPDGTIYGCGRAQDAEVLSFGNITEVSFAEALACKASSALADREAHLRSANGACVDCNWWDACHGGCPMDGFLSEGDLVGKTTWCASRRRFLEHHTSRVPGSSASNIPVSGAGNAGPQRPVPAQVIGACSHMVVSGSLEHCRTLASRTVAHPFAELRCIARDAAEVAGFIQLVKAASDGALRWALEIPSVSLLPDPDISAELVLTLAVRCFIGENEALGFLEQIEQVRAHPPQKLSFIVDLGFKEASFQATLLASLGFRISLDFGGSFNMDSAMEILDYYLHTSTLEIPIEPFHTLVRRAREEQRLDLWSLFGRQVGRNYFVDEQGQVSVDHRHAAAGVTFGAVDDDPLSWSRSPHHEQLSTMKWVLYESGADCVCCRHFNDCLGFFISGATGQRAKCRDEREFLDIAQEAAALLRSGVPA